MTMTTTTTLSQRLTRTQLRELEKELQTERARLERSLSSAAGSDLPDTDGPATRVPDSAEGGVAMALAERAHARYQAIVAALDRVAAGTYGICVRCGSGIPYGRLVALPEAARCLGCGPDA